MRLKMLEYLDEGQVWRHYKGGLYKILGFVTDCDSNQLLVRYSKIDTADAVMNGISYHGVEFTKPFSEWFDIVDADNTIRFERARQHVIFMTDSQRAMVEEFLSQ